MKLNPRVFLLLLLVLVIGFSMLFQNVRQETFDEMDGAAAAATAPEGDKEENQEEHSPEGLTNAQPEPPKPDVVPASSGPKQMGTAYASLATNITSL
jgi:hypothetical protein